MPPVVVNVIHTRASRRDVEAAIRSTGKLVSGGAGGANGLVRQLQTRVGLALLERVRDAFIVKARGGTDETGEHWKPLSKRTVAYTRRHPGLPKNRPFWKYHPSYGLKQKERDRWWELYRRFKGKYGGDKHRAAAAAWTVLKSEGCSPTLMERYGDTPVEILRDKGLLLNSLSPGADPDSAPASPPKQPNQVFRNGVGEVMVGTNRKHCLTHHKGTDRIPQRRLWPEPSRWTPGWWSSMLVQAQKGAVEIITYLLGRL